MRAYQISYIDSNRNIHANVVNAKNAKQAQAYFNSINGCEIIGYHEVGDEVDPAIPVYNVPKDFGKEPKAWYYVIGGQYESYCYGKRDTLIGAKRLATANAEFWDNFQGWKTPYIYKAEDVHVVESKGSFFTIDGAKIIVPKIGARPCARKIDGKWESETR